jgi:hypothetical protein
LIVAVGFFPDPSQRATTPTQQQQQQQQQQQHVYTHTHATQNMPVQLLPASAAAYAPRASVNVVLGSKTEPWLTQTLKRVNRVKRPLNSVQQHQRCLTDILSSKNAIWTLASLMLANAPDSELDQDEDMLVQAIRNYEMMHLEAYIVHVDMVLRNEVAFKLTTDTIDALVKHHKEVFCVNAKADTYEWSEKEQQCKKLHDDFVQAVNRFVFRTHVSALEGMEEEGAGELLCGKSEEAKNSILNLLKPLLPPPPRVVDVVRQPPLLPNSPPNANMWSQPTHASTIPAVDAWRVLPSNSPVSTTSAESAAPSMWSTMSISDHASPQSCYSPPETFHSPPQTYHTPYTSAGLYWSAPPISAPMHAMHLPSMLSPPCGMGTGMGMGMGHFGWDNRFQDYATTI